MDGADRLNARKSLRRRTRPPNVLPTLSLPDAQSQTRREDGDEDAHDLVRAPPPSCSLPIKPELIAAT